MLLQDFIPILKAGPGVIHILLALEQEGLVFQNNGPVEDVLLPPVFDRPPLRSHKIVLGNFVALLQIRLRLSRLLAIYVQVQKAYSMDRVNSEDGWE